MSLRNSAGGETFDVALPGAQRHDYGGTLSRATAWTGRAWLFDRHRDSDAERFARHRAAQPRRRQGGAGRRIVLRFGHPPAPPPRGVVLFAPCSCNSLNKLAHGIADNLALSVVAEAIGRGTPVIVGPSLNASPGRGISSAQSPGVCRGQLGPRRDGPSIHRPPGCAGAASD
jgi:hypothetical protein